MKAKEYYVRAVVPCDECGGTGITGYWYCEKCRQMMETPRPTADCSHPPDKLRDMREECTTCRGAGCVDVAMSLVRLAELLKEVSNEQE